MFFLQELNMFLVPTNHRFSSLVPQKNVFNFSPYLHLYKLF